MPPAAAMEKLHPLAIEPAIDVPLVIVRSRIGVIAAGRICAGDAMPNMRECNARVIPRLPTSTSISCRSVQCAISTPGSVTERASMRPPPPHGSGNGGPCRYGTTTVCTGVDALAPQELIACRLKL
jgi:hypothetical protein